MDLEASLHATSNHQHGSNAIDNDVHPFAADWDQTDTTSLHPNNIARKRVQRAWDRKPSSPFAPKLVSRRVKKVWRRTVDIPIPRQRQGETKHPTAAHHSRNQRLRAEPSEQSPLRIVKKSCVGTIYGQNAQAREWEMRGGESPVRKIRTRSAVLEEELEELSEGGGDAEAEVEALLVEDVAEDGQGLDDGGDGILDDDDWEDEHVAEESGSLEIESISADADEKDDTDTELDNSMCPTGTDVYGIHSRVKLNVEPEMESRHSIAAGDVEVKVDADTEETGDGDDMIMRTNDASATSLGNEHAEESTLLSVSPVRLKTMEPLQSTLSNAAVLVEDVGHQTEGPLQTNASVELAGDPAEDDWSDAEEEGTKRPFADLEVEVDHVQLLIRQDTGDEAAQSNVVMQENGDDASVRVAWMEPEPDGSGDDGISADDTPAAVEKAADATAFIEPSGIIHSPSPSDEATGVNNTLVNDTCSKRKESDASPSRAEGLLEILHNASKPIAQDGSDLQSDHPAPNRRRLSLRQSPRRLSPRRTQQTEIDGVLATLTSATVSPRRRSSRRKSSTPGRVSPVPILQIPFELEPVEATDRSASGPPDETTPQKSSKPRVSDDTALLQAFLFRAAENKVSKASVTKKRASSSNRRDSNAVRHALASPAKPDVLCDLDPNSPSPRKAAGMLEAAEPEVAEKQVMQEATQMDEDAETISTDVLTAPQARRSARDRRRRLQPQPATAANSGPNKISIRGNGEPLSLQRTAAQERARITIANTRRNKAGIVMPSLVLAKLAAEQGADGEEAVAEEAVMERLRAEGARMVRWAEVLEHFSEEPSEPDLYELGVSEPVQQDVESETPSREKAQSRKKLRVPNAATPAKAVGAPPPADFELAHAGPATAAAARAARKRSPAKQRSRIATPAKRLSTAALLPADLPSEGPKTAAREKKALRQPVSKLPSLGAAKREQGADRANVQRPASPVKKVGSGMPSIKAFGPRLEGELPSLASPAKKGRKAMLFGAVPGLSDRGDERAEVGRGLSSPAKKRTKRLL